MVESDLTLIVNDRTRVAPLPSRWTGWNRTVTTIGIVAMVVVSVDQAVKAIVSDWLGPEASSHRWWLADGWLALEYVENTGAAFGILSGQTWLLSALAVAVALGFVLAFRRELPDSRLLQVSIGLVVGGGIGNFVDRVRLNYVVDFIAVGIWPRFNLADSAITIGLAMLASVVLRDASNQDKS